MIIIASFTPRVYCRTRSEAFAYELTLEVLWAHALTFRGSQPFCRGRINLISLQRIISKTSNNEIQEVQKNRKAIRSFLNKSYLFFFFLPLFAISSCSPRPTMPRRPSRAPSSPLFSSSNSIALFSLPSSRIESAWWKQISLQRHNRMADAGKMNPNGFFFFFSMCSRLKLRPDLQM